MCVVYVRVTGKGLGFRGSKAHAANEGFLTWLRVLETCQAPNPPRPALPRVHGFIDSDF